MLPPGNAFGRHTARFPGDRASATAAREVCRHSARTYIGVRPTAAQGLDHVIFVTAVERKLLFRQYHVALKRSGTKTPRVELAEMGPSLDLALRRTRRAPEDLLKEALRQPKLTGKKVRDAPVHVVLYPNTSASCTQLAPQYFLNEALRKPRLTGKKVWDDVLVQA